MPDSKTNWTLFVPIYNLEIASDIGGELTIERVTFISTDKIPRIRRRLGLPHPISYYRTHWNMKPLDPIFTKPQVYACIKTKRSSDEALSHEFNRIQEAVYLLASSQFNRERRRRFLFGGPEATSQKDEYIILEHNGERGTWSHTRIDPIEPYRLDKEWKCFFKRHFFFNLIKILNHDIKVDRRWRYTIRQAALLAGQSQFANKVWESFLYNMIAIESLLVNRMERAEDAVTARLFALFGWLTNERAEPWKEKLKNLYDLRNKFVHTGNIREITERDLIDTDEILSNLLRNICKKPKYFNSKEVIIELNNKLEARRELGMKPLERPKGIYYSSKVTKETDNERLWWQ